MARSPLDQQVCEMRRQMDVTIPKVPKLPTDQDAINAYVMRNGVGTVKPILDPLKPPFGP